MNKISIITLTIFYGLVIWFLDQHYTDVSITPVFSITWLLVLSFYQSRSTVLACMLILLVFVILSLWAYPLSFFLIRTISFGISGTLASLFAHSRERSVQLLTSTLRIVNELPLIVVATDAEGAIIAASDKASELAKDKYETLVGHHFPDVFMGDYSPGDAVRLFHESLNKNRPFDDHYAIRGVPSVTLHGTITVNGKGSDRLLVVIFNRSTKPSAPLLA